MITFEALRPGTSTPCQKLSAPKITLSTSDLNASTIFDRGMPSLCENKAMFRLGEPRGERPDRRVHHPVRGEQHERLSVRLFQVIRDRPDRHPFVRRPTAPRGRAGFAAGGS